MDQKFDQGEEEVVNDDEASQINTKRPNSWRAKLRKKFRKIAGCIRGIKPKINVVLGGAARFPRLKNDVNFKRLAKRITKLAIQVIRRKL